MKTIKQQLCLVLLLCVCMGLNAQNSAPTVISSQTIQNEGYRIQVGLPFLGSTYQGTAPVVRNNDGLDLRFPWDVLYLTNTFGELPDQFSVSKGFFGDRIELNWQALNNQDLISRYRLERRAVALDGEPDNEFEFVANISATDSSYEDSIIEGGVLYEYKLIAEGITEIESYLQTFITGIGYRNPTATVTGNIAFESGAPVKNVVVRAEAVGGGNAVANALLIEDSSSFEINVFDDNAITNKTTVQFWVKPEFEPTVSNTLQLFSLSNGSLAQLYVDAQASTINIEVEGTIFEIKNFFPSGNIDARGDQILSEVNAFLNDFIHYTFVLENGETPKLYINGQPITAEFANGVNQAIDDLAANQETSGETANQASERIEIVVTPGAATSIATPIQQLNIGGGVTAIVDEIRVWNTTLNIETIQNDFKRYIGGNHTNLSAYFRADEGVGNYAYDLSRSGFKFHQNHSLFPSGVSFVSGEGNIPTASQFGILGNTDANGNYEISAIPYAGNGESFLIVPGYPGHEFEPNSQLVFLGSDISVANKIDFTDVSSFRFDGNVLFDSRGIFGSFQDLDGDPVKFKNDELIKQNDTVIIGYNNFKVNDQGVVTTLRNGNYWVVGEGDDREVHEYARIACEGANVFIDGQIVLDENNMPVETDQEGNFTIQVPIGLHYIEVKKNGHEFTYNGRFPAQDVLEFFEPQQYGITQFINTTKVEVVGKVVGGSVEAAKTIGFGAEGIKTLAVTDSLNVPINLEVSAKNNIGVANITLGYKPAGTNPTPTTKTQIITNTTSGEYRANLLPLQYELKAEDIKIPSRNDGVGPDQSINLLEAGTAVTLNYEDIVTTTTPEYVVPEQFKSDIDTLRGEPYHYKRDYIYRSNPVIEVLKQTALNEIEITTNLPDDQTEPLKFSTEGIEVAGNPVKIYQQFGNYQIELKSFERYINEDDAANVLEDEVAIVDGELNVTNNLALVDSEEVVVNPSNPSLRTYSFKAGIPAIAAPFTRDISVNLRIDTTDYPVTGTEFVPQGIILGGASDGSQTFVTAGPDVPDIILRDPPGSNSFASIEAGEEFTITREFNAGASVDTGLAVEHKLGVKYEVGGGFAGPVIETDLTNNIEVGISSEVSSSGGNELTKTYSFNQTISTSDDPEFVGSAGDLYIGQSKNYFYGTFNNVVPANRQLNNSGDLELTNAAGESFFISLQRGFQFVEEPSDTFFVLSQHQILNSTIPELLAIIDGIDNGQLTVANTPGLQSRNFYQEQIRVWRGVIKNNERAKFRVSSPDRRAEVLNEIIGAANIVEAFINEVEDLGNEITGLVGDPFPDDFIEEQFFENVSFDAGVGEFTRSISSSELNNTQVNFSVELEQSVTAELGLVVNGFGFLVKPSLSLKQKAEASALNENQETTTISYTLKDNDFGNFLSVDVINAFDGNGPIFSTQGGRTSCPQEGAEYTLFYNHDDYNANPEPDTIDELAEADQEQLSFATQPLEVPMITVAQASVTGIPENNKAEFRLTLENNTVGETGADSDFLLIIDNTTNPDGAQFNLEPNGTVVHVPEGEQTEFLLTMERGAADVFEYNDIKVVLRSLCDVDRSDIQDSVLISTTFIPVCTTVELDTPLDNWLFNRDSAGHTAITQGTNTMPISFSGFDAASSTFGSIELQQRAAIDPSWTILKTYYTEAGYNAAIANGANAGDIEKIDDISINYNWDILGANLQDGDYEVRVVSFCTDGTEYISELANGRVDLNGPRRFGNPLPSNGILSAGENIQMSFNEDIFYNNAVSKIEIKGATNQLEVKNDVSINFGSIENNVIIDKPNIQNQDLSIQFWMHESTQSFPATILKQQDGIEIGLNSSNQLYFTLNGKTVSSEYNNTDDLFHHYTFTYSSISKTMSIYEDNIQLVGDEFPNHNFNITNNESLVIGGSAFVGNMHSFRLWGKYLTLTQAIANQNKQLIGNEPNILGYWTMQEGKGEMTEDKARSNNARVNADWAIFPITTSYSFDGSNHLEFDLSNSGVIITSEMDATLSMWFKADSNNGGTLFSNGKGNGEDVDQSDDFDNKWALAMSTSGGLNFTSEGVQYSLTDNLILNDGIWHHVALLVNRLGALQTYVDGNLISSNDVSSIGGFSNSKLWLGARAFQEAGQNTVFDDNFTGEIDEVRLWNSYRTSTQIERDQYDEIAQNSLGLLFYTRLNKSEDVTGQVLNPSFALKRGNGDTIFRSASPSSTLSFANEKPPIKSEREVIEFLVTRVVNENTMILEPQVSSPALIEGQILDITVDRMFDDAGNRQVSPVTWTVFMQQNEVSWFANGFADTTINYDINFGEEKTFTITLENKGGLGQPYQINNIPNWLSLSSTSGELAPDSNVEITATVSPELSVGEYLENISLKTDFGYDQQLLLDIRVLAAEPDWDVDPTQFDYSMNVVGTIRVDDVLSEDTYDNIAAFVGDEVRGSADLIFNEDFQGYFVFLTAYSNVTAGENLTFKIWDASKGQILEAELDGVIDYAFINNQVVGTLSNPGVFENTGIAQQNINLNSGWTWVSFNVNDDDFSNLNDLTRGLNLETTDRILAHSPAQVDTYEKDNTNPNNSGWAGTISGSGGISSNRMYRIKLTHEQSFVVHGTPVSINDFNINLQQGWNWLAYPLNKNVLVNEALTEFKAQEGDVIKSQTKFAIFDENLGWQGNLTSLEANQGYLINASSNQNFTYPRFLTTSRPTQGVYTWSTNQNEDNVQTDVVVTDYSMYSQNMNMVVQLPEDYEELFVYNTEGVLRGYSNANEIAGTQLNFITIYGDSNETLFFSVANANEIIKTTQHVNFASNSVIGTIKSPYVIQFEDNNQPPVLPFNTVIYPNPFQTKLMVDFEADHNQSSTIELFDVSGRRLFSQNVTIVKGNNSFEISPKIPSGAYILSMTIDGKLLRSNVLKK